MNDDDLWFAPIRMQEHTRQRATERLGWRGDASIVGEIRLGLLEGRWSRERPPWTVARTARPPRNAEVRLYVWGPTFGHCWVLRPRVTCLFLVTVLLEQNSYRRFVERGRGVRAGSARA